MKYCYYRIYQLIKKVKTNDTPAFSALLLLVLVQTINIATILSLIKYFTKIEFLKQNIVIGGLAISFLFLGVEFKVLFGKINSICKKYENETKAERQKGSIYVISYILLSLIFLFVVGETLV